MTADQNQLAIRRMANEFGDLQCLLFEYDRLVQLIRTAYTQLGGAGAKGAKAHYTVLDMDAKTGRLCTVVRRVDIGQLCLEFDKVIQRLEEGAREKDGAVKLPSDSARHLLGEELREARATGRASEESR